MNNFVLNNIEVDVFNNTSNDYSINLFRNFHGKISSVLVFSHNLAKEYCSTYSGFKIWTQNKALRMKTTLKTSRICSITYFLTSICFTLQLDRRHTTKRMKKKWFNAKRNQSRKKRRFLIKEHLLWLLSLMPLIEETELLGLKLVFIVISASIKKRWYCMEGCRPILGSLICSNSTLNFQRTAPTPTRRLLEKLSFCLRTFFRARQLRL